MSRRNRVGVRRLCHRTVEPHVRYRILVSIEVQAADDRQAAAHARKLGELLKGPLVRMAVESEGVPLSNGGDPIVYKPKTPDFFGLR